MAIHVVNHCYSTRALFFFFFETMDLYNEENEAELKSDAKDVIDVCSTGKNQVKVQCDRKKKKSAANSKGFVCACCVPWWPRGCAGRIRDFGEDEGSFFASLGNTW